MGDILIHWHHFDFILSGKKGLSWDVIRDPLSNRQWSCSEYKVTDLSLSRILKFKIDPWNGAMLIGLRQGERR